MKMKTILVMATATAAIAVAASSAFAATPEWLIAGGVMTANEPLVETKTTTDSALLGKIIGIVIEILCEKVTIKGGELIKEKTGSANLLFSSCSLNKPTGTGCRFPDVETIALLGTLTSLTTVKFTPKTGTTFASITLEGCTGLFSALNGKHMVTEDEGGGQTCEIVTASKSEKLHLLDCLESGAVGLLFEGETAEFEVKGVDVETTTNNVSVS